MTKKSIDFLKGEPESWAFVVERFATQRWNRTGRVCPFISTIMMCTHQAHDLYTSSTRQKWRFENNYAWNSAKKWKFHHTLKITTCSGLCHIIVINLWFQPSAPIGTDSKLKNTTGRTEFSKQFYCQYLVVEFYCFCATKTA